MDENLSASELRRRYQPGGSAQDSELTASQLRSRYGVPSNKCIKYILHMYYSSIK